MKRILLISIAMPLALMLGACQHDLSEAERGNAKLGALEYAKRDYEVVSVSPQDSDGDGYTTVTLRPYKAGPDVQILCGYKSGGSGCKPK